MKISDEAVKAAQEAYEPSFDYFLDDDDMRAALTAALPFLQGVKVDAQGIYDYVQSYEWRGDNCDYTPNDADREMLEDAIVGYLSALEVGIPAAAPSPRSQALEEAALERSIECWRGMKPSDVMKGSTAQITYALEDARKDILTLYSALSYQPVADEEQAAAKTLLSGNMSKLYDACSGICKVHKFKAVLEKLASTSALPASPGASTHPTGGSDHGA